jgi:hypothetical protein
MVPKKTSTKKAESTNTEVEVASAMKRKEAAKQALYIARV